MCRFAVLCFLIFQSGFLIAQNEFRGNVTDKSGQKIPGAIVRLIGSFHTCQTDANGDFYIKNIKENTINLEVYCLGYSALRKEIVLPQSKPENLILEATSYPVKEVMIEASRADNRSAMTYTEISEKDLDRRNFGQDLPMLLSTEPGVVVNSDAGTGIGYTGLRVRGSDPTRINITVNGIPMNDAESHGLFWVNTPDLASSVSSVQLQRGVGTSTQGAGAFGATLNLQTNEVRSKAYASYTGSAGSFNTLRNTFEAGTGLINGFTFDMRLSKINSDGFIDRAASDLKSFWLSGAWLGRNTSVRANVFSGKEKTYQAWYGVPQDSLEVNPTYNPAGLYYKPDGSEAFYDNETDNYQQDHYQFFVNHRAGKRWNVQGALHYTRGRGYYEQFRQQDDLSDYGVDPLFVGSMEFISGNDTLTIAADTIEKSDLIRKRWLDNHFFGGVFSAEWDASSRIQIIFGGGANVYTGKHFGEVVWAQFADALPLGYRYYDNDARKVDLNAYAKANLNLGHNLYGLIDLQLRSLNYSFLGFNQNLESVEQTVPLLFFNPKAGLTWEPSAAHRIFVSHSIAHREPVRDDFTQSSVESRPRPERLNDTELGYRYAAGKFKGGITAYWMQYRDQLVLTGEINDVGAYNRVNIPESYRAGLELELGYAMHKKLDLSGNVCFSQNKIAEFTEYVDDWDTGLQQAITYRNTDLAFSPRITSAATVSWKPNPFLAIDAISRYVGKQYLDNTESGARSLSAFYVQDVRFRLVSDENASRKMELSFLVSNVFDTLYTPNGYTFSGIIAGQRNSFNYLFPQAGRNYMLMLKLSI
ncbi:MAG: TonB-dependent receptor [Bacteroidia bacterium]